MISIVTTGKTNTNVSTSGFRRMSRNSARSSRNVVEPRGAEELRNLDCAVAGEVSVVSVIGGLL
jgi:hypothetical protein